MLKKIISSICIIFFISGLHATSLTYEEGAIIRLLEYVEKFSWGGYHTLHVGDQIISGRRNPKQRLQHVLYNFTNKSVLDIGSNEGGMLFEIADKIRYGVGIELNPKLINVANKLKSYHGIHNLDFYVFDLDKEPLECISSFLKEDHVDICFLLSVCRWIKNWKAVIDYIHKISDNLLFEANGSKETRKEHLDYLKKKYHNIQLLSATSDDDPKATSRCLYLCSKKRM